MRRLPESRGPDRSLRRRRGSARGNRRERGAALVIAILVLAILTVIGIALMLITSTESRIAANAWSGNRAFYASVAGIRWATVEMSNFVPYLSRPEFAGNPFGTVLFQMPSHRHAGLGPSGFFQGDPGGTDIQVRVQAPSLVGSFPAAGEGVGEGPGKKKRYYVFEVRSAGNENDAFLQYSKALVSEVAVGPLPDLLF
jgi:hypothetical protein